MKFKILHRAIIILILCLIALVYINLKIYLHYINSSEKTKALFGIVEYLQYSFKYYFLIPETVAGILIISSFKKYKNSFNLKFSILLLILTLFLNLYPIWKWFV